MTTYAIVLNEPNEDVWNVIRQKWPGLQHYMVTDVLAFIAPEEPTLTSLVADEIGMNREGRVKGLVVEADTRSGFNSAPFIEWLNKVE